MKWGGPFDPEAEAIWVPAHLFGPRGETCWMHLIFDTGTPVTIIDPEVLESAGFNEQVHAVGRARFLGVVETTEGPVYPVPRLTVFGRAVENFEVAACKLGEGLEIDGILGLDFVREIFVTLDFKEGALAFFDTAAEHRRIARAIAFNGDARPKAVSTARAPRIRTAKVDGAS